MRRPEDYRPSGAATWVNCTGYIDMRAMYPDAPEEADTEVTEDGTACHWVAGETYEGRAPAEGTLSPNNRVITEDMIDAVDLYLSEVASWPNVAPVCEKSIPIDRIVRGMRGTPDMWAYDPNIKTLYIADLKYGFRFVEVWENYQLICYACGLLDMLGLSWEDTNIVFTIVQPRSQHREGPVRKWKTTARYIKPFVDKLIFAAHDATRYMPNPGCFDCPGRHTCVAFQNATYRDVELAYGGGSTHELSPAALGKDLAVLKDAARRLEGRISGLEVAAEDLLRKGKTVPGWSLEGTYAREGWREGADVELTTLAEKFFGGVTVTKPPKLITPKQARAVLPSNIVAIYAHRPSTGVRLTKQDPYKARKVFDK